MFLLNRINDKPKYSKTALVDHKITPAAVACSMLRKILQEVIDVCQNQAPN